MDELTDEEKQRLSLTNLDINSSYWRIYTSQASKISLEEHQLIRAKEAVLNPKWDEHYRYCDWREYISDEIQEAWDTFSLEQKLMLYRQAEFRAECKPDNLD